MALSTEPAGAGWTIGDRISSRYFFVTLAIFIAVGVPAYVFLARQVEQQFLDNYSDFSLETASVVFSDHLGTVEGGAYTEPLSGTAAADFRAHVEQQVNRSGLLEARVWRPDGMLVYSRADEGLGRFREIDGGFAKAISTGAFTEITSFAAEVAGQSVDGKALEIYLPIYKDDGTLANVFELYYSLDPLNATLGTMRITVAAVLAILFVAVVATAQLGSQLLVRRNRQLARMTARLAALAETDGLTGAYNHRHFYKELEKEIDASSRYGRHTSLIMADLDFFKRVNDTYGHPVGDIVLRESAVAMSSTLRATDTLARYGGEEFATLLPETDERHAVEAAERLRAAIGAIVVPAGDDEVTITASFGVAEFPGAALDPASLVAAADSALYYAKKNGRDQVCAFSNLSAGTVDRADVDEFFARLENAGVFTVQALAAAVMGGADEPGRPSGSVHLARVASGALGLGERDSETLELAASVYDVGKLTIPGGILEKRSALTTEEAEVIREHPEASERILSAVGDLERILKVVRYHHEHFDGSGYPDGLRGEEIPYLARVLLVIDAFNAMIAPRSYREAMTPEAAVAELRRHAGTQFDPEVVEKLAAKLLDPTTSTRTLAA